MSRWVNNIFVEEEADTEVVTNSVCGMNMNNKKINYLDFYSEVFQILAESVGRDYARCIAFNEEFLAAVKQNVEETSAWEDEGYYTDDDIRLAIGRIIMEKFNIEY